MIENKYLCDNSFQLKRVFVDMDGVLVNFRSAAIKRLTEEPKTQFPQSEYGFFIDLPPIEGAIEAYKRLDLHYDVRILTRPSPRNLGCYSEKAFWVRKHLGYDAQEKMILSCDKSVVIGHYLIDDTTNAKQEQFEGTLIRFGSEQYPNWESVL